MQNRRKKSKRVIPRRPNVEVSRLTGPNLHFFLLTENAEHLFPVDRSRTVCPVDWPRNTADSAKFIRSGGFAM